MFVRQLHAHRAARQLGEVVGSMSNKPKPLFRADLNWLSRQAKRKAFRAPGFYNQHSKVLNPS